MLTLRNKPAAGNGEPGHAPLADAATRRWSLERADLYCSSEVRILVMDDDDTICRVVQAAFAPQGFIVDTISDPAGMEAQLKTRSYHVIVLDYVIPGLLV